MTKPNQDEMVRRIRLRDLRRYCRHRYGAVLPDDDAGRHDLRELLLPVSLGAAPARVMANTIQIWAPWMSETEAAGLIAQIQAMPRYERCTTAEVLGKRLNVINAEREQLGLRTIAPADMTKRQFAEYRKAKRRMRQKLRLQRKRQQAGRKPRSQYLAASRTKQKPWKAEGISRASWYRRKRSEPDLVRQVCLPMNSFNNGDTPVSRSALHRSKRLPPPRTGLTPNKTTTETTCCNTSKSKH
jgi:hypothetical protein